MRVTQKYILSECNRLLEKFEIDYVAYEIYKTRYRGHDYEGGASHFNIRVAPKNVAHTPSNSCTIFVFYPIYALQDYLNNGYRFTLELRDGQFLNDSELSLIRSS